MRNVLEALGFVCLVVFAFLIFRPAAVGVAGVLLVVAANTSGRKRGPE